jgi:predicted nucleotidyltransferase
MTVDVLAFVRVLAHEGVEFVVLGGVAANLHGAARTTLDLDVAYNRSPANIARIVRALAPYAPYLRGAPPGLPFTWDEATVQRGLNFTLTTTLGDLDLLGDVAGGGGYEALVARAEPIDLEGGRCWVVTLPTLIALKRAAGRPKDLDAVAELEALLEERGLR